MGSIQIWISCLLLASSTVLGKGYVLGSMWYHHHITTIVIISVSFCLLVTKGHFNTHQDVSGHRMKTIFIMDVSTKQPMGSHIQSMFISCKNLWRVNFGRGSQLGAMVTLPSLVCLQPNFLSIEIQCSIPNSSKEQVLEFIHTMVGIRRSTSITTIFSLQSCPS